MTSLATAPPAVAPVLPPPRSELAGSAAQDLVVVVAPANGRFQPVIEAGPVSAGAVVARITTTRSCVDITAPTAAIIKGLLTLPGQLVTRGQALAWAQAADDLRA